LALEPNKHKTNTHPKLAVLVIKNDVMYKNKYSPLGHVNKLDAS